jgi:hypothetical protein
MGSTEMARTRRSPVRIFDWLTEAGYEKFCLFTDAGFFAGRIGTQAKEVIESLAAIADSRQGIDNVYWDVFAAWAEVCDRAIQNNLNVLVALCGGHAGLVVRPSGWLVGPGLVASDRVV